jgi:CheY-like chemotaxis protein
MASILLVDDESDWLELILHALPEYQVDVAQSYSAALAKLGSGVDYDVAIVDLNLLRRDGVGVGTGRDGLGGKLLEIMRDEYPSTCRIALTGLPPTSTKDIYEQYGVTDLLLKGPLAELADVRRVVERALQRSSDIPEDLKAERRRLSAGLRSWKADANVLLDQRARTLENDIADADRMGKVPVETMAQFRELRAMRSRLATESAALATQIADIRTHEEAEKASRELERLKIAYQV